MTANLVVSPAWEIRCDGCGARHIDGGWTENVARGAALQAGWQTRPFRGKGSRSAPDLCPNCKPAGASS